MLTDHHRAAAQLCMHLSAGLSVLHGGQVTQEMLQDTSTSVDIYSALHDPIRGYVRLFLEFFPIHPSDKAEDEPDPFPHEIFRGCVFSNHRNFSQSKEVPALDVSSRVRQPHRLCHGREMLGETWCACLSRHVGCDHITTPSFCNL